MRTSQDLVHATGGSEYVLNEILGRRAKNPTA